ncbi:MAG: hypothetical protein EAZ89_12825 [Bacteroidetes bacterium]|nr:MAG: hypothetical protein EAZ89_12825 [Bacteroidota bacterium]
MSLADIAGTSGVSLILMAYVQNVRQRWSQDDTRYLLLNGAGAALACFSSVLLGSVPFTILEGVWTMVSVGALVGKMRRKS